MPRLMDMGLSKLTNVILQMAELSKKSVATSMEGFRSGRAVIDQIYQWSEELRELEDETNELATEIIARYQPVASDLRYIEACLAISNGFFRFGRYAYDIAEVLQMFGDLSNCEKKIVEETAATAEKMLQMSIEAFLKRDVELAKKIKLMDDIVDANYREHIGRSMNDPKGDLKCVLSTTLILRYLERIADHADYIGDLVVYITTGFRVTDFRKSLPLGQEQQTGKKAKLQGKPQPLYGTKN
jgi:phosphate transport system protein